MFPISSSTSTNVENNWRTYFDAKRLIRQTEQRLNETRTIYPHVHLTSNHYETIDNGNLSTSLSSNSFFHRSTSHNGKIQSRDSEALQTIRRKINRQKLAAERRAEQLFHSQSDAGHVFDNYRPSTTNYSTSASLQNLHYSPHRQTSRPGPPVPVVNHHHLTTNANCLSQSQSFPSELDTVLRHSRGTSGNRENEYPRTMASVVPKESLSYTNGRTTQQRSSSASKCPKSFFLDQDLPTSRLLTPTDGKSNRRVDAATGKTTEWRTDLLVTRKSSAKKSLLTDSLNKRPKGLTTEDDETTPSNLRSTVRKELSTPLKQQLQDLIQQKRPKEKTKRSNEPPLMNKRPSAFTPVTPKEFTEQTRHRLLRLLGSSTDYYPSSTIDQTSSFLERSSSSSSSSTLSSSSSSSVDSIVEVSGEKLNGRSRSEPPVSNGTSNGDGQRHKNLLRWAAILERDCDLVENRFKYFRPDVLQNYDSTLQYDDGNLRHSSLSNARPSSSNENRIQRNRAAATIQAAYRGYSVRKSLLSMNEKEKQLHSEFNQRPSATISKVSTELNESSLSVTPIPSPNLTRRRSISPPLPPAMSPDNGRPLVSTITNNVDDQRQVHIQLSMIDNGNDRKASSISSSSTVKKRKSRSPSLPLGTTRHRDSQMTNPSTSLSSLTAREKRNIQKFNSDVELQAYEKRLKDIEKKIRVLVKRAIEIFDEKRNISSPTTSNVQRPKSSLSEDISQSQHEKSERESETTSTRASSETVTSDVSDLERRVHDYSEQLKAKKKELERLKRRNKELLRRQETELKRQIDSYDKQIQTLRLPPSEQTVPSPSSSVSAQDSSMKIEIPPVPIELPLTTTKDNDDEPDTPRDAQSFSTMTDIVDEEKPPFVVEPDISSSSKSSSRSEPSPAISPPIDDHPKPSEIVRPASPHVADYDEDFSDTTSRSQRTIPEGKILDIEPKSVSEETDEQIRPTLSNASLTSRSSDEPQSVILNFGDKSTPRDEKKSEDEFPPPPLLLPEPINDDTSKDTSEVHDDGQFEQLTENLIATFNEQNQQDVSSTREPSEPTSVEETTSDEDNRRDQSPSPNDEFSTVEKSVIDDTSIDPPDNGPVEQENLFIDLRDIEDKPSDETGSRGEISQNIPVEELIKPVVSHSREQVFQLSHDALTILFDQNDKFDDRRRINTTIPDHYFQRFEQIDSTENVDVQRSRRAYARMIFDLCVELLNELDTPNVQPAKHPLWEKSKLTTKRFYRISRPTSRDETEKLIQKKIFEILNLAPKEIVYSKYRIPPPRHRDEKFEAVLYEELRRTEVHWINYDEDSIRIKFDLAERIFEQLIDESLTECLQLVHQRQNASTISTSA